MFFIRSQQFERFQTNCFQNALVIFENCQCLLIFLLSVVCFGLVILATKVKQKQLSLENFVNFAFLYFSSFCNSPVNAAFLKPSKDLS